MSKNALPTPSLELLQEMFAYDPEAGILTWKSRPKDRFPNEQGWRVFNSKHVGKQAGYRAYNGDGIPACIRVGINQINYSAHRLIWALVYGEMPLDKEVDHINRDPFDNRLSNLRLVTPLGNILNRGMNKNNSSGLKGVAYDKKRDKYTARIMANYRNIHIGRYETKGLAAVARAKAELRYHGTISSQRR